MMYQYFGGPVDGAIVSPETTRYPQHAIKTGKQDDNSVVYYYLRCDSCHAYEYHGSGDLEEEDVSDERGLDPLDALLARLGLDDCECGCRDGSSDSTDTRSEGIRMAQFADDMWDVIDRMGNVLISKQEDYGPLNISRAPGGALNGLRVRMYDKIARINNLIDTGADPKNESLRDSFLDLANYGIIALMVLDGTWPKLED
jgi:hypothetical protein